MRQLPFEPPDYSVIAGTEAAYRSFFPRPEAQHTPPGAQDFFVPVADDVEIGCRLHSHFPEAPGAPTILFFHGNGETVNDYDDIAPMFKAAGANFLIADYRGYGFSTGMPSFPTMISDAHAILQSALTFLEQRGCSGPLYIMGRSLGCHSALELAAHYPERFKGLITESGATSMGRMVEYLESAGRPEEGQELQRRHRAKIAAITLPVLVIHGEWDELIPLEWAVEFFETLTTPQKQMEVIPQAGHNDILWVGRQQYVAAVKEFVARTAG